MWRVLWHVQAVCGAQLALAITQGNKDQMFIMTMLRDQPLAQPIVGEFYALPCGCSFENNGQLWNAVVYVYRHSAPMPPLVAFCVSQGISSHSTSEPWWSQASESVEELLRAPWRRPVDLHEAGRPN